MFGLNLRATIKRPVQQARPGGDRRTTAYTVIAENVPCAVQEARSPQQYLPGGQVVVRASKVFFRAGVDVQENDFVTISDGREWRIEHVVDDAGRGHHLVCEVKTFS